MWPARIISLVVLAGYFLFHSFEAVPGEPSYTATGRYVFETNCAICHGAKGDGRGEAAVRFATSPRDLTKAVYKFRSTGSGRLPTDEDLIRIIIKGVPGIAMVAQDHLTTREIREVVDYIKSLSTRFAKTEPAKPLSIPPAPVKNRAAIAQGQKVYVKGGCVECHGKSGRGDGPSASQLSVRPSDLTHRPLKSGPDAQDIFRSILTGLDGTSMPSYHLTLRDDEMWQLTYYVESLGDSSRVTEDERMGREIVREIVMKRKTMDKPSTRPPVK